MATEREIADAKEVLRSLQRQHTRRHGRVHDDAADDNANRLRALEGLCGECVKLKLYFDNKDGKDVVALGCRKRHSPLTLYRNTLPGVEASCDGYAERVRITLSEVVK